MIKRLEKIFWKEGKIINDQGHDLTDKAEGIGGIQKVDLFHKKDFKNYVLKLLDELRKTNSIYEKANSFVILKKFKKESPGTISTPLFIYEFQYSQI